MYLASLRLAVALVCVGVSLILGGQWLGLIPDAAAITMRGRQTLCEAVAVNAAAHIRKQQWVDLRTTLQTQVDRNEDLLSIGLRSDLGSLRVDTGHHEEMWPMPDAEDRKVDAMQVPITLNRREWGDVEFCFRQTDPSLLARMMHHPMFRLIGFFVIAGLLVYTAVVARVLGLFNGTQVVPDRVRQALDTLAEGLLVLDEDEKIVLANRAFADTVGIEPEDLASKYAGDLSWVVAGAKDDEYPWSSAIYRSELQTEQMVRYRLDNGTERIFSVNAAPLGSDGAHRGALATFRDVTHVEEHRVELENMLSLLRSSRDEIKRKNGELEILATQDALTGCLNRRAFFDRFGKLWKHAKKHGTKLSCVMIDNDHFKSVNDTYGHHIGDEVLRRVATVIKERHQDQGLVCRYGGEEFCVVLPGLDIEQAVAEAEKTRVAISDIRLDEPAELRLAASLGVSELRFDARDPQDLINQSDTCLYVAKRAGRNQVVSYNPSMASDDSQETEASTGPVTVDKPIPFEAVTALVSALSYRDANTAEHSRRVSDLCARAAVGVMDPHQIYVLEIAALLHDIGKIGVPDHILLKPGALTKEEWEVMGRHDRIGVEIIGGAFDCPDLYEIVRTHHAFYGGAARDPHLPTGDEISIGARMLTICDSYDAMVSDRVYRKGRSHEEAIEELRRCAGTQFDPELVEHFAVNITGPHATCAHGALSVQKQMALQIGTQVSGLADAIDNQDADGVKILASRLGMIARSSNIETIAAAADKIEQHGSAEEIEWLSLLRDTNDLLDLCRATQSEFLKESLTLEAEPSRG